MVKMLQFFLVNSVNKTVVVGTFFCLLLNEFNETAL